VEVRWWNHVGDGLFMEAMYVVEFLSQVMPPSQFFNVVGRCENLRRIRTFSLTFVIDPDMMTRSISLIGKGKALSNNSDVVD
jgi:hypothetical protein